MSHDIDAVFLDVGNTLRIVVEDEPFQAQARRQLVELVGADETPEAFHDLLEERYKVYRKQAKATLTEAPESELWTRWMLPDWPAERIAPLAGRLTRLWRDTDGRRVARPDVKATVLELDRRGYCLGIIANTITETEIPDWMVEDGVAHYFKTVILSSKVRLRKPDPAIYDLACRAIGKPPENCAYIGDNPIRDVEGTRAAGWAMMVRIDEPDTIKNEPQEITSRADHTIAEISELLGIFPPLANRRGGVHGKGL